MNWTSIDYSFLFLAVFYGSLCLVDVFILMELLIERKLSRSFWGIGVVIIGMSVLFGVLGGLSQVELIKAVQFILLLLPPLRLLLLTKEEKAHAKRDPVFVRILGVYTVPCAFFLLFELYGLLRL